MFRNARVVCREANRADYHRQDSKPGDSQFVVSCGTLMDFAGCPDRWIRGYERAGGQGKRWRGMLECLHLTPQLFKGQYSVRPDTYQVRVNKCPSCGSESPAAVCRKCGLRRRAEMQERPWAGGADYCKKWMEAAGKQNLEVVKVAEHQDGVAAAQRLQEDPAVGPWLTCSDVQVWVSGEWQDVETGIVVPVRTLIQYVPHAGTEADRSLGALRTTRDAGHGLWRRQCYYASYHVRAAWCLDLWTAATGEARSDFYFAISENVKPFEPARRRLSPTFMQLGRRTYETMLRDYCRCLSLKLWPSYDRNNGGREAWTEVETEPWMHQGEGVSLGAAPPVEGVEPVPAGEGGSEAP